MRGRGLQLKIGTYTSPVAWCEAAASAAESMGDLHAGHGALPEALSRAKSAAESEQVLPHAVHFKSHAVSSRRGGVGCRGDGLGESAHVG